MVEQCPERYTGTVQRACNLAVVGSDHVRVWEEVVSFCENVIIRELLGQNLTANNFDAMMANLSLATVGASSFLSVEDAGAVVDIITGGIGLMQAGEVRQLRYHFGPFLTLFQLYTHLARAV